MNTKTRQDWRQASYAGFYLKMTNWILLGNCPHFHARKTSRAWNPSFLHLSIVDDDIFQQNHPTAEVKSTRSLADNTPYKESGSFICFTLISSSLSSDFPFCFTFLDKLTPSDSRHSQMESELKTHESLKVYFCGVLNWVIGWTTHVKTHFPFFVSYTSTLSFIYRKIGHK